MKRLAIVLGIVMYTICVLSINKHWTKPEVPEHSLVAINRSSEKEDILMNIVNEISKLPVSAFQSNLYVILGVEAKGDSEELNPMLKEYARMKIAELNKIEMN